MYYVTISFREIFIVVELKDCITLAVMTRLKRVYVKMASSCDHRITLTVSRDTSYIKEHILLQVLRQISWCQLSCTCKHIHVFLIYMCVDSQSQKLKFLFCRSIQISIIHISMRKNDNIELFIVSWENAFIFTSGNMVKKMSCDHLFISWFKNHVWAIPIFVYFGIYDLWKSVGTCYFNVYTMFYICIGSARGFSYSSWPPGQER